MHRLMFLFALALPLSAADEIDILTMKDGRVIEGVYDPVTGQVEITIGKTKGSVTVDPKDILRQTKKIAPKVAAKPPVEEPVDPAKKQANAQNMRRSVLTADLAKNKEWKLAAERRAASMDQQQKLLPDRLRAAESQLSDARRSLSNAESAAVSAATYRDWYYNNHHDRLANDGTAQAEVARRRAAADVAKCEAERDKLLKEQTRIARDLPQAQLSISEYAQKIADIEKELAAQPAAAPPAGAAPGTTPPNPDNDLLGGTQQH